MKRGTFIKNTAIAAPLVVAFNPLAAMGKSFLRSFIPEETFRNRILVLIELNGGNDGLNTIIPVDKYSILSQAGARKDILIPENKILKLNDTNDFGFHPSLGGLQKMYNDKLVSAVQGVGYPGPEFSHFYGQEIKYTANILRQYEDGKSGWVGRWLQHQYEHYPAGYPLHHSDGPPAMRLGEVSSVITQFVPQARQDIDDMSIGITNIDDFNAVAAAPEDEPAGSSRAASNINKIRAVAKQIRLYAPAIQDFSKRKENLSKLYPAEHSNPLADQLKVVARLIGSGLNTPVYVVYQTGYDTHADQVDKSDTTQGAHAKLLKDFSEALAAFEDDLQLMGKHDDVLGMTFSEFGRRIAAGSYGTDHGTAETVILFGTKLKNGIIGKSPELPSTITYEDNLQVQYDFRALYKTVLSGWLGAADETVKNIISEGPDAKLDLFKG